MGLEKIINRKITVEPIKGCWFIRKDWSEYTTIRKRRGHRFVYEHCIGPIAPGKLICHKCDRPGCINPKHLFQGTSTENYQDAVNKKRAMSLSNLFKKDPIPKELREKDRWKQLRRFCGE